MPNSNGPYSPQAWRLQIRSQPRRENAAFEIDISLLCCLAVLRSAVPSIRQEVVVSGLSPREGSCSAVSRMWVGIQHDGPRLSGRRWDRGRQAGTENVHT